jgi:hypothetical protein
MHIDAYEHARLHNAAQDAAAANYAQAHRSAFLLALDAFGHGGAHTLPVSGWSMKNPTVRFVFLDYLAGPDPRTDAVIQALQSAADGNPEARLQAQALIADFAR